MTQQKAKLYAAVSDIKKFIHCKSKKGMRGKDPQQEGEREKGRGREGEGERRERERGREGGAKSTLNFCGLHHSGSEPFDHYNN